MKVCIVTEYFPPKAMGGGELSAYLLAKNLAKKIDVTVVTSWFKGLKVYEVKDKIKISRRVLTGENVASFMENLKRARFADEVRDEVLTLDEKENFDVFHLMNITSITDLGIKKPVVVHINSPLPFCPKADLIRNGKECDAGCNFNRFVKCFMSSSEVGKMKNAFYMKYNPSFMLYIYARYKRINKAMRKANFFMPISNYMAERLVKEGVRKDKIKVIPNIIELDRFLRLKECKNKKTKILYLGAYTYSKGVFVLLEALKGLKNYECNFYGDGFLRKPMKKYINKNKLNVRINKPVSYSSIHKLYQKHDIVVFPSLVPEAFGRVALEAMASARPVIASDIGGVKDIVDSKTGIMIKPGSVKELRKALEKLISNKKPRQKLGNNGRVVAKKRFGANKITEDVIGIYKKLVK